MYFTLQQSLAGKMNKMTVVTRTKHVYSLIFPLTSMSFICYYSNIDHSRFKNNNVITARVLACSLLYGIVVLNLTHMYPRI